MITVARALVALAFALTLYGPAALAADPVRDAVDKGNHAFIAAFLRGDGKAVAALYTEDAMVIAPGAEVASGRAAIAAFWQKVIDSGVKNVTLSTMKVESAADLAYEDGTVKLVTADGKTSSDRYVVVWKRSNGEWKLHRDIWNSGP